MAFTDAQVANLPDWLKDFYRSTGAIETPDPEVDSPVYRQAPYRPQYVRPLGQEDMISEGQGWDPNIPVDKGLFDLKKEVVGLFDSLGPNLNELKNDPMGSILGSIGIDSDEQIGKNYGRAFTGIGSTSRNIGNLGSAFSTVTGGSPLGLAVGGIAGMFEASALNDELANRTTSRNSQTNPRFLFHDSSKYSKSKSLDLNFIDYLAAIFTGDTLRDRAEGRLGAFSAPEDFAGITDTPQWTAPTTWQNPDTITDLNTYTPPPTPHGWASELENEAFSYPDNFDDGMFDGQDDSNDDSNGDSGLGDDEGFGGMGANE